MDAPPGGLEPPTPGLGIPCSIRLSYGGKGKFVFILTEFSFCLKGRTLSLRFFGGLDREKKRVNVKSVRRSLGIVKGSLPHEGLTGFLCWL